MTPDTDLPYHARLHLYTYHTAYFNKANSLAQLNKFEEAIAVYKETFKYEEPEATTYYYIGECYEKKEELDHALNYYHKAVKLDALLADGWMGIGIVLDMQHRLMEGVHYIKKALDIEPENSEYWFVFAEVQEKLGFLEEAEMAYKKVIELDPANTDIWLSYSNLLFEQEDKNGALELLAEGIKHHPDNAELQYRIAGCLMQIGQKQEAMSFLQNALRLNYEKHNELFEYLPQLKENSSIVDLIESYKK